MGVLVRLTGIEQARRCLAAAREAGTWSEVEAWERLARRYMNRYVIERSEPAFGDAEPAELMRDRVGAR